jgi:hypothetical protein
MTSLGAPSQLIALAAGMSAGAPVFGRAFAANRP